MEFGKVTDLSRIDWTLPDEDPSNASYLNKLDRETKIYVGAPAWGCKDWVGKIYPPKTPANEFLYHYARNFNCIELNTTHYRIPDRERVRGWCKQVPEGFLFCPKIPQLISHRSDGLRDRETRFAFLDSLAAFDQFLGPSIIQLPPYFSYDMKAELFHFLKEWPDDFSLSLELRHPSWFENRRMLPALTDYLRGRGIGLVILDVAGRRDLLHSSLSAPFSLLRLIGNDLDPSDYQRASAWTARISEWSGLERFFFMVHEPDDKMTPEMASYVIEQLNQECRAGLTPLAKPLIQ